MFGLFKGTEKKIERLEREIKSLQKSIVFVNDKLLDTIHDSGNEVKEEIYEQIGEMSDTCYSNEKNICCLIEKLMDHLGLVVKVNKNSMKIVPKKTTDTKRGKKL